MLTEKNAGQGPQPLLRNQPFASPEQIGAVVQDSQRQIKSKLQVVQRSMQLYLANRETELILYRPIKVTFFKCNGDICLSQKMLFELSNAINFFSE